MEREAEQGVWSDERQQAEFERQRQATHILSVQEELSSAEGEIERVGRVCVGEVGIVYMGEGAGRVCVCVRAEEVRQPCA